MRLKLAQLMPAPQRADDGLCYDGEALWLHSLAVAQVADHLAKRTKKADPDLASTLGLLHDIGKLAINSQFPEKVAELWEHMCPAQVYEAVEGGVEVTASNCVQCGAISAKGGRLTPPEGGSGPEYTLT